MKEPATATETSGVYYISDKPIARRNNILVIFMVTLGLQKAQNLIRYA
jgi:hypothetical protein